MLVWQLLAIETVNPTDRGELAVIQQPIDLFNDLPCVMAQDVGVEFRNLWKRNRIAFGFTYTRLVRVDIIRRQPLSLLGFYFGKQFIMSHIMHFPLPSAEPSVLDYYERGWPLVTEALWSGPWSGG